MTLFLYEIQYYTQTMGQENYILTTTPGLELIARRVQNAKAISFFGTLNIDDNEVLAYFKNKEEPS